MKLFTRYSRILLPSIIFVVFFYMSCQENPTSVDNNKTSVAGTLVDEQGTPIPLAIIEISNPLPSVLSLIAKDTTDEDGKFSMTKIPADIAALDVKITHQDFKKIEVKFRDFKSKTSNPYLLKHEDTCVGQINIYTNKSSDSTKLSDVEVRLFRDGKLIRKSLTKDGELNYSYVCPGIYLMRVYKYGYGLIYDSVEVKGSDTIPFHYFMQSNLQDSCCHGMLTLTLKDSASGALLSDVIAYLYLNGNKLAYKKSDSNGIVIFTDLCPGDYYANFSKSGYNGKGLGNIHLDCNDTVLVEHSLPKAPKTDTCCTAAIIARVMDGNDSSSISGATVYVFKSGSNESINGTTDSNGYFRAFNLCAPGSYTVKALKDGYNYQYLTVSFIKCDTQNVALVLTKKASDTCCKGIIYISLKDSTTGEPIKGASSYLYLGSTKLASAYSDSTGLVIFSKICPGDYIAKFSKSGYNGKSFENIHMDCNDTLNAEQYLSKTSKQDSCCTAAIITHVVDGADSSSIPGATVYVFRSGGETITGTTDQNGNFSAYGLCAPGAYTVKATKDGYNYQYLQISFAKCDTQNVTLVLTKKASDTCCKGIIYISLKDSTTGEPIKGASSYLYLGSTKFASAYSDSTGLVIFSKICPGDYYANFSKSGYNGKGLPNIHMDCNDTFNIEHYLSKAPKFDTCCTAAIETHVFDSSDSTAIQWAAIIIYKDNELFAKDSTDADGNFNIGSLCAPGKYTVRISKTGYKLQYLTVEFKVCKTEKLNVGLTKE